MRSHQTTTLSPEAKLAYIAAIKKTDPKQLQSTLIEAAIQSFRFPKPINENLDALQLALQKNQHNEAVKSAIQQAITTLISTEIFDQFIQLAIKEEDWQLPLIYYLSEQLKIKIDETPIVQATIQEGKIYWRIVQNDEVVYDRHPEKQDLHYTRESSWYTDWKTFRLFKDGGKRHSPVVITKELFVAKFEDSRKKVAESIWDNLKEIGILNAKNRLSHHWRALSKVYIKLPAIESLNEITAKKNTWYFYVSAILQKLANDPKNGEEIASIPNAVKFRHERTPKSWAGTGYITNSLPNSADYCTKLWDVSFYTDLKNHHNPNFPHDNDHIPSASALRSEASTTINTDLGYAIAIPRKLHQQGATYLQPASAQQKSDEHPFLKDVSEHLHNLESRPNDFSLADQDYLVALGAFRYLYRAQCKPLNRPITGTELILGQFSHSLFQKPNARKDIDNLFTSKIKSYLANH